MGRLFGTDGVRGLANRDLTAELALEVAVSAAAVLGGPGGGKRLTAVVGRDSRASGEFLEAAVVAGLASAGVDVTSVGVLPTPAVAYLTAATDADLGVMLSASHNPMPDNGIKLFAKGGHKLEDAAEDAIEGRLGQEWDRPTGAAVGRIRNDPGAIDAYRDHLLGTLAHRLDGLKVVVDCANGAASQVAPDLYRRAGAQVIALHADPDGLNINQDCGSTHLEVVARAVRVHGADLGIAHDGDADRCLAVDAQGNAVDGDHILAILAIALRDAGRLPADTVVTTVMANLGFKLAMDQVGIKVVQTAVGDRYVLECMKANDYLLGGEQSGHLVLLEHATTGDGLLTALHLMGRMAQTGDTLDELAGAVLKLPQVLVNVGGVDKARLDTSPQVADALTRAEAALGTSGRVLLRPSGTEPLVRVMVEAPTQQQAQQVAADLAAVVRRELS